MSDLREAANWDDLMKWHLVRGPFGNFRERFLPESLAGIPPMPLKWFRFVVTRDEWREETEDGMPERTILEIRPMIDRAGLETQN